MIHRLLKPVPANLFNPSPQPQAGERKVSMRYLGTAGFVIKGQSRTLVVDPFVTRPDLMTTLTQRLTPDKALIRDLIPTADDVLIGHAHHDHVLDGPDLCLQTGARFIGSPSACNVARAAGLPEGQIRETRGREVIASGDASLRGIPSRHGRVYFNHIPLTGDIVSPPQWPAHYSDLRHGLVLNWHIEIDGVKIVHIDSADFIDHELEGLEADVVCLCAIGRRYRANYVETAIAKLKPKFVIACHWDWFFTPYHETPRCLPGVDLHGFIDEIAQTGASPVVLPFDGEFLI